MWPDWVSNPGPLTYESGALPTALRGPAERLKKRVTDFVTPGLVVQCVSHYAPIWTTKMYHSSR